MANYRLDDKGSTMTQPADSDQVPHIKHPCGTDASHLGNTRRGP